MHSLSCLLGIIALGEHSNPSSVALTPSAEDALKEAVFHATDGRPLANVLFTRLKQPFEESKEAAFRCALSHLIKQNFYYMQ